MKYYELFNDSFDIGSGSHNVFITRTKNKEQLETLKEELNLRYGYTTSHGDYNEFIINEIDTDKIPENISESEYENILNRRY